MPKYYLILTLIRIKSPCPAAGFLVWWYNENMHENSQYKNLTPRRKDILEMRTRKMTLQEIGNKLGISRERVRQILKKLPKIHKSPSGTTGIR